MQFCLPEFEKMGLNFSEDGRCNPADILLDAVRSSNWKVLQRPCFFCPCCCIDTVASISFIQCFTCCCSQRPPVVIAHSSEAAGGAAADAERVSVAVQSATSSPNSALEGTIEVAESSFLTQCGLNTQVESIRLVYTKPVLFNMQQIYPTFDDYAGLRGHSRHSDLLNSVP